MPWRPTTSWSPFPPLTTEVQFDEKWSFVAKKEAHCDRADPADDHKGDYWDHVAYDPEHPDRVDVAALLDRADVNALLDRVNVDALLSRVDVNDLIRRVDVDTLVEQTDLGAVIARSSGGAASEALDAARSQAVGLDQFIDRWMQRALRRKHPAPSAPSALLNGRAGQ